MNVLAKLLSFLWRCWFVFLASMCTLFLGTFFMLPFSFREKDFPKVYFFMRIWAYIVFYGCGLRLEKQNFTEFNHLAPYIVISNHTSMMDIMVMVILNKKPMVFVGKKELSKLPIFGSIFKKTHILVDRQNKESRKNVYAQSKNKINQGRSICIFPEGKVPKEEVFLDEFKNGPFNIAIENKIPIVNLSFCGLKQILPYAYFKGHPGKVKVIMNNIEFTDKLNKNDMEFLRDKSRKEMYNSLLECAENKKHY